MTRRAALLLAVAVAACRQDMHDQPRVKPLARSEFFADGRSARPLVEGTVARGQLREDERLHTGKSGQAFATAFPFPVDRALLDRGQQRYGIYCAPCHGYDGRGQGMVPTRVAAGGGNWQARNLVEPPQAGGAGGVVVQMPNGQLFNTISNGYNTMMGYAQQIPHADRWAIVAYVRALQRAQDIERA